MKTRLTLLLLLLLSLSGARAQDVYNQIDEMGNVTQRRENQNFNKHNNDTTRNREIPKGLYVWTIDRKFGDMIPAQPDTLPHLFMNNQFNTGVYGEYNTTGSNYTSRLSRIFINRAATDNFIFTQPYSFVEKRPETWHFMNTLSPYTSILYDNCGDKVNGEDHIDAKFAVNAGKRLNVGFDLDYAYARGYFSNQSLSHFNGSLFSSYTGDKYNMHFFFNAAHQKITENGGITDDNYITHPESFQDQLDEDEIPTILKQNWNRNDHQHIYLTHRYNIGFYRKVKMTEAELKARAFAEEAKKDKERREAKKKDGEEEERSSKKKEKEHQYKGRPEGARIMGAEPKRDSIVVADNRISVEDQAKIDSLNRAQAIQDSIDATMKREFVPVTSFFHTFEWNNYRHIYQAYATPANYYLNQYYVKGLEYGNDSIYDETKHMQLLNTLGVSLLEGFNKYMKAGLKGFITFDYNNYQMPDYSDEGLLFRNKWTETNISFGGLLSKTQGKTFHFNLRAETWIAGPLAGQLKLDFNTDVNFKLFGDTVRLAANAFFQRIEPVFLQRHYHSKHIWWDNDDLSKETRTHIEGRFSYEKTNTMLRIAIDEIQNYTYYGMSYDATTDSRTNLTAGVYQASGNINVFTAQLNQNFRLGILNWENVLTYQNSSNKEALPLPSLNYFTNLYLKFRIAKVLNVELGADAFIFTKYYAPDYCPAINQFAVQQNEASRVELGNYPFIDAYVNFMLKRVRFYVMMSNVNSGSGNGMRFLAPHYPTNSRVLRLGISWPFFN